MNDHFDSPVEAKCPCEYVWMDSDNNLRSKVKTLPYAPTVAEEIPKWNFDGSSTGQATVGLSDVDLIPVGDVYPHPFLPKGVIVFCQTRTLNQPCSSFDDTFKLDEACDKFAPWFAFEQEYTLLDSKTELPLALKGDSDTNLHRRGMHYCGNGCNVTYGRDLVELHYTKCLEINLNVSGTNAEVMPGQWEYQLGPCSPVQACVQLALSRFILLRLAERFNYVVSFSPKPVTWWNVGSGLHTNFSTISMRESYASIVKYVQSLEKRHADHMAVYGKNNKDRLTGMCETSEYDRFTWGVGDRSASVRIPMQVNKDQKGYLEDRRPSANANPFDVVRVMLETLYYQEMSKE